MSQWGAFGYAALDHGPTSGFSPTTTAGRRLSSSDNLASTDPTVSVDLNENDGDPVVVTSAVRVLVRGECVSRRPSRPGSCVAGHLDPLGSRGVLVDEAGRRSRRTLVNPSRRAVLGAAVRNLEPGADDLRARRRRSSCSGTVEAYDAPRWRRHPQHPPARGIRPECDLRRGVVVVGTLRRPHGRPSGPRVGLPGARGAGRRHAVVRRGRACLRRLGTVCDLVRLLLPVVPGHGR